MSTLLLLTSSHTGRNLPVNVVTFNGIPVTFNGLYVTYTP